MTQEAVLHGKLIDGAGRSVVEDGVVLIDGDKVIAKRKPKPKALGGA